ncbi:malto-oligosyltrehalose trehalohydrolase, partial [Mycobacterium tuberculosis]|nr:malto-oligosyltrehalose trehalohydrolase [Mycobacterium tuberculosis]
FPYAPAHAYGGPAALRAFIEAAHDAGLSVLLDVVYNHFGPQGNHLRDYARGCFRDDRSTPWGEAIDFCQPWVRRFFIDNALKWL